jgi:carbon monoxide dehydrogenase subunit G
MPVIDETVVIAQPMESVFQFLCEPANVKLWDSSIVEAEQIGTAPLATGTKWRGVTKILGKKFTWTTEITDAQRPGRMESRSIEGKLSFTLLYELTPHQSGTLLRYRIDADSGLGGVFGRLGDPLVQSAQGRTVRSNLKRLSEMLAA